MSFKLFIIPALVLSLLYGFAMATMAHAETVTVTVQLWNSECELVDDMVECDISSQYGIQNVHVFMNAGIGDVTVLDQDFRGCPTEVHVSIDPVVVSVFSEMEVTTCPIPCLGCDIEVCIVGVTCEDDLPGVGVGKPDPLPLKSPTAPSVVKPLVLSDGKIAPR